ncbi:MAG: hypothetical protein R3E86_12800 [Pseudomonadales bacterium]
MPVPMLPAARGTVAWKVALIVASLALASCSARQNYQFGVDLGRAKAECERLQSADERADCEAAFQRSYQRYQQEREEIARDSVEQRD